MGERPLRGIFIISHPMSKFKVFLKLFWQNASADLQEVCLLLNTQGARKKVHRITMTGCLACREPPPLPRRERDLSSKGFGDH